MFDKRRRGKKRCSKRNIQIFTPSLDSFSIARPATWEDVWRIQSHRATHSKGSPAWLNAFLRPSWTPSQVFNKSSAFSFWTLSSKLRSCSRLLPFKIPYFDLQKSLPTLLFLMLNKDILLSTHWMGELIHTILHAYIEMAELYWKTLPIQLRWHTNSQFLVLSTVHNPIVCSPCALYSQRQLFHHFP